MLFSILSASFAASALEVADLDEVVDRAGSGSRALGLDGFPGRRRLEVLAPEGKRAALRRAGGVDRAPPVPEDALLSIVVDQAEVVSNAA